MEDKGETKETCCSDCGCADEKVCENNVCGEPKKEEETNEPTGGEDIGTFWDEGTGNPLIDSILDLTDGKPPRICFFWLIAPLSIVVTLVAKLLRV
jgi:hypothetical protein